MNWIQLIRGSQAKQKALEGIQSKAMPRGDVHSPNTQCHNYHPPSPLKNVSCCPSATTRLSQLH